MSSDHHPLSLRRTGRTGRTTRMLEAAAAEIKAGKRVLVVVPGSSADAIAVLLATLGDPSFSASFAVVRYSSADFDWCNFTHKYSRTYPVLFVDHYVIERHLGRALQEMHRFDLPYEPPACHKPQPSVGHTPRRLATCSIPT